ncbi:hypothetical protein FGB62_93g020 [Gracilaria domingensis]|nr:hypothetical protein FGB62_93g020 [Gracilaria domingensis]
MSVLAPEPEQSAHIRLTVKQVEALLDCIGDNVCKTALIKEIRRNVRVIHSSDLPVKPVEQSSISRLAEATRRAQAMVARLHAVRQANADLLRREIERTHEQATKLPSVPTPQFESSSHLQSLAGQVNEEIDGTVDFIHKLAAASEDTKKRVQNVTKALEIANGDGNVADHSIIADWTGTFTDIMDQDIEIPLKPTEEVESYPDSPFVTPRSKMRKRVAMLSRMSPNKRSASKLPR